MIKLDLPTVNCPTGGGISCQSCYNMCSLRPCWGTPEDAKKLIEAGYSDRLMTDFWVGDRYDDNWHDIQMLAPAMKGYEGGHAPSFPNGACTFLTSDGFCELHNLGLKPYEGRVADCREDKDLTPEEFEKMENMHRDVAQAWNDEKGQKFVNKWVKSH